MVNSVANFMSSISKYVTSSFMSYCLTKEKAKHVANEKFFEKQCDSRKADFDNKDVSQQLNSNKPNQVVHKVLLKGQNGTSNVVEELVSSPLSDSNNQNVLGCVKNKIADFDDRKFNQAFRNFLEKGGVGEELTRVITRENLSMIMKEVENDLSNFSEKGKKMCLMLLVKYDLFNEDLKLNLDNLTLNTIVDQLSRKNEDVREMVNKTNGNIKNQVFLCLTNKERDKLAINISLIKKGDREYLKKAIYICTLFSDNYIPTVEDDFSLKDQPRIKGGSAEIMKEVMKSIQDHWIDDRGRFKPDLVEEEVELVADFIYHFTITAENKSYLTGVAFTDGKILNEDIVAFIADNTVSSSDDDDDEFEIKDDRSSLARLCCTVMDKLDYRYNHLKALEKNPNDEEAMKALGVAIQANKDLGEQVEEENDEILGALTKKERDSMKNNKTFIEEMSRNFIEDEKQISLKDLKDKIYQKDVEKQAVIKRLSVTEKENVEEAQKIVGFITRWILEQSDMEKVRDFLEYVAGNKNRQVFGASINVGLAHGRQAQASTCSNTLKIPIMEKDATYEDFVDGFELLFKSKEVRTEYNGHGKIDGYNGGV
ncbi:MAG: hypothetical protein AAF443_05850 [Chlamydiota bacterium]